ncbi:MAG: type II CAAX prenyl endopeptidase Rce1 family protein [Candidatus Hodarchaeota archaeon]
MLTNLSEENKRLKLFLIYTFLFSWLLWLPSLLSSIGLIEPLILYEGLKIIGYSGPLIVAFSLTYHYEGLGGVKDLWKRGWDYKSWKYLLIALLLLPSLYYLSLSIATATEGILIPNLWQSEDLIFQFLFFFFLGGAFQEEFGWRGYALDKIQSNWNALESSLILGGIWSLWHFPLFFIIGTAYTNQSFISLTIATIILSVIFTWLYNNSNGSILIAMVFHTSNNLCLIVFPLNYTLSGTVYYTFLLDLVVVFIVIYYGPKSLIRKTKLEAKMGIN